MGLAEANTLRGKNSNPLDISELLGDEVLEENSYIVEKVFGKVVGDIEDIEDIFPIWKQTANQSFWQTV